MDDEIDRMNRVARGELMKVMEGQPEISLQALNAIIIARALERQADHATNISRDVIFWIRGGRHPPPGQYRRRLKSPEELALSLSNGTAEKYPGPLKSSSVLAGSGMAGVGPQKIERMLG